MCVYIAKKINRQTASGWTLLRSLSVLHFRRPRLTVPKLQLGALGPTLLLLISSTIKTGWIRSPYLDPLMIKVIVTL